MNAMKVELMAKVVAARKEMAELRAANGKDNGASDELFGKLDEKLKENGLWKWLYLVLVFNFEFLKSI